MRSSSPVPLRVLLVAGVTYAAFAASLSHWFTRSTGLSRWTMMPAGPAVEFANLLGVNLAAWCGWGLLAVLVFRLGRRVRFDRATWVRALPFHVVASVVVTTTHVLIVVTMRVVLQTAWGLDPAWWPSVQEALFRTLDAEVPVYWALLGLQHAADYHREVRARDVAAAQLETRLAEARLQALKSQLHPHFLFNTLHAISTLVHRDPDRADAMIERLSDMLRVTLASVGVQEVTLRQELDFLRAYLDIEHAHFGARLSTTIDIAPGLLDALVPNLLLQPLAENALRHGLAPLTAGGALEVRVWAEAGDLVVRVSDDGRGLSAAPDGPHGHGVGLTNTRARLDALYRGAASLSVEPRAGGGVQVTVRLPRREHPAAIAPEWHRKAS